MPLKYIAVLIMSTLLVACAAPRPVALSYLDNADAAIARQDWEVAYRFIEDGLISSQPEVKARALSDVRQHPQILQAASRTFSKESIAKTLSDHGEERGLDIEKHRAEMYRVVATTSEYELARSNIESAAQLLADKRKSDEQHLRDKAIEKAGVKAELVEAAKNARFLCQGKPECEKAFSLTQIFLSEHSDMKIQVATDTIIETYNPTDSMKVGLKAIKMPRKADTAEIFLTATCRDDGSESFKDWCDRKLLTVYRAYPTFMESSMRP